MKDRSHLIEALMLLRRQSGSEARPYRQAGYLSRRKRLLYVWAHRLGLVGALALYLGSAFARRRARIFVAGDVIIEDHSAYIVETVFGRNDRADPAAPRVNEECHGRSRLRALADLAELAAVWRVCRPRDFRDTEHLVHSFRYYRVFDEYLGSKSGPAAAIMVDEFTPRSTGLLAATKAHGRRAGLFLIAGKHNVDYLASASHLFDVIFCQDVSEVAYYRNAHSRYSYPDSTPIELEPLRRGARPEVGLLLSSFYYVASLESHANALAALCDRICETYGVDQVRVRPHPADVRIAELMSAHPSVRIEAPGAPFEDFAGKVDLAFAGNTSAIVRLLNFGTPVVYVPDLDTYGYDLFRYVRDGVVPESRGTLPSAAGIVEFFSAREAKLAEHSGAADTAYVRPGQALDYLLGTDAPATATPGQTRNFEIGFT